eukprot:tig00001127_g7164.t1
MTIGAINEFEDVNADESGSETSDEVDENSEEEARAPAASPVGFPSSATKKRARVSGQSPPATDKTKVQVDVRSAKLPHGCAWGRAPFARPTQFKTLMAEAKRLAGWDYGIVKKYSAFSREVYGEVLAPLVRIIIKELKLTKDDVFLDIGCGWGNVVFQVAAMVGCRAVGIEIQKDLYGASMSALPHFERLMAENNIQAGKCEFYCADASEETWVFSEYNKVFMNNFMFPEDISQKVLKVFEATLLDNAMLLTLRHLDKKYKPMSGFYADSPLQIFRWPFRHFCTRENVVSWTATKMEGFVYVVSRKPKAPEGGEGSSRGSTAPSKKRSEYRPKRARTTAASPTHSDGGSAQAGSSRGDEEDPHAYADDEGNAAASARSACPSPMEIEAPRPDPAQRSLLQPVPILGAAPTPGYGGYYGGRGVLPSNQARHHAPAPPQPQRAAGPKTEGPQSPAVSGLLEMGDLAPSTPHARPSALRPCGPEDPHAARNQDDDDAPVAPPPSRRASFSSRGFKFSASFAGRGFKFSAGPACLCRVLQRREEAAQAEMAELRKRADQAEVAGSRERTARRTAEAQLAQERTAREAAAAQLAQERTAREAAAAQLAQERAAREAAAAQLAQERTAREAAAAQLAQERAAREAAAAQLAQERTAREASAAQLAQERTAREAAAAQLAQERTAREAAAAQLAQERAAREAAEAQLARSLPEGPQALANVSAVELEQVQQRLYAATGVIAAALAEARRQELERERDARVCVACLENARSVICMPCRHKALCDGCFEQLRGRDAHAQCPICRAALSLHACVTGVLNP